VDKDLKLIIKKSFITSFLILLYGLIVRQKTVYIAMCLGSLVSICAFYLIIKDTEYIVHSGRGSYKTAIIGYIKRYALYGIFLFIMIKIDISFFALAILGLLNTKFNILLEKVAFNFLNRLKDRINERR
jgi:hypothetical protein